MPFFMDRELDRKRMDSKAVRTIKARGGALMASEMRFDAGAVGAEHDHPHEQIVYVVSGELDFTVEGETRRIGPGDSIYVPSGVRHGVVSITDSVLLDVFTPQRDDFLK